MLGEERRPEDEGRRTRIDSGDERGLGATSVRAGVASPAGFGVIGRTRGGLLDMPTWSRASLRCCVSGMEYEQARSR